MDSLSVEFKVVAVSSNTNSFGLRQAIMIANNGLAYAVCANSLNLPKQGEIVTVPYKEGPNGMDDATLNFAGLGFEIPERKEDAPREVINEVWG